MNFNTIVNGDTGIKLTRSVAIGIMIFLNSCEKSSDFDNVSNIIDILDKISKLNDNSSSDISSIIKDLKESKSKFLEYFKIKGNAEILSNAGNITSEGKIFNTLCAKILGKFNLASHGFENGIGSLIQGEISIRTTSVPNDALLFNFGNIHATSGVLSLSSDYIMKNTGNISSDTSISMEAPELRNDAGKISANAVDLIGVQRESKGNGRRRRPRRWRRTRCISAS